jgi:flagellar protein FlaI
MLIVGEIRGAEAYTLFQALATGHGGMATMHADSVESAVKRLTSKPMDIAPAYMPLMNIVASIRRVHLTEEGEMKAYRRVVSVDEVADYEQYKNTFKWRPVTDDFSNSVHDGIMLQKIGAARGLSRVEIDEELERRKNVLHWMRERNIRSYKDVAAILTEYYSRPKEFYEREVEAYASA